MPWLMRVSKVSKSGMLQVIYEQLSTFLAYTTFYLNNTSSDLKRIVFL